MIIGTAGHIDHGKSTLVRALTGVDTDRLQEEKIRGISIDLGFAYMPGLAGSILGFVDVPGHERFVRNMLAGATGIDFVLLVVAADDGVMPQTLEHLAIVDLLDIPRGLVVLSKVDRVSLERRSKAVGDIRRALAQTHFRSAEIIPVSSMTGEGLETLRERLLAAAASVGQRDLQGGFRLTVDRCFSITGVGTIVTGPVLSGIVSPGDQVVVSPSGLHARVRSIHAQGLAASRAAAGQRCALNLVGKGVGPAAIVRGEVVLDPPLHAPTDRIDATLRLLPCEIRPLSHWAPVRLHHGAAELHARIALLQDRPILPGAEGRIQLVLDQPIAAAVGDRFIMRDSSGSHTLGGGRFLDLRAPARRRRTPARLTQLEAYAEKEPAAALTALLDREPYFVDGGAFARDRVLADEQFEEVLKAVPHLLLAVRGTAMLLSPLTWERIANSARETVEAFHRAHPELLGPGADELFHALKPRLPAGASVAAVKLLVRSGALVADGGRIRMPGHQPGLDINDRRLWARIVPLLQEDTRFRPPRVGEIAERLAERVVEVRRVLKTMSRHRVAVEIAPDRFISRAAVAEMAEMAAEVANTREDGLFSVGQFRDRLGSGRNLAIAVLEYFDRHSVTVRAGDLRRINRAPLRSPISVSDHPNQCPPL